MTTDPIYICTTKGIINRSHIIIVYPIELPDLGEYGLKIQLSDSKSIILVGGEAKDFLDYLEPKITIGKHEYLCELEQGQQRELPLGVPF